MKDIRFPILGPNRWSRGGFLLLALLAFTLAHAQSATVLPTRGTRFWTGFMQNGFGAQSLKIHILSHNATSGTISMPLNGWSVNFALKYFWFRF